MDEPGVGCTLRLTAIMMTVRQIVSVCCLVVVGQGMGHGVLRYTAEQWDSNGHLQLLVSPRDSHKNLPTIRGGTQTPELCIGKTNGISKKNPEL